MPLNNEDNLDKLLTILQNFMDEYGIADPEPELTYMSNRATVIIHLDEFGPSTEDVDLLDLETRIGQCAALADVDVDIELIDQAVIKDAALPVLDDDANDDDDDYTGYRTFSMQDEESVPGVPDDAEDHDTEAVVKSFMEEEAISNVVVCDDYEPTEEDIQDLYDRFDDYTRMDELEDMGDWN